MNEGELRFVPLGGVGEFGANVARYGFGGKWLMGDCGVAFADDTLPGIDLLAPDLSFISEQRENLVGLVLTQYPALGDYDLSSLRCSLVGAAPLSADMQERIQEVLGSPVIQGYGLTETSPITNSDYIESEHTRPGSIGPAMSDTKEKVVDLETGDTEVAPEETGELLVHGPQVMKGYHNNPQATSEIITEDGWLRTGDIVRADLDGYLWIVDRKKDLIKYKGFQVPPAELEGILLEHPAVADAAVIG